MCVGYPDTWHKEYLPALADCKTMVEALHRLKAANARLTTKLVGTDDLFTVRIMSSMQGPDENSLGIGLPLARRLAISMGYDVTLDLKYTNGATMPYSPS